MHPLAMLKMQGEYQNAIDAWMLACFGKEIAKDQKERNYRFLEEALELVQSCGITQEDCLALVKYVFERPVGDKIQEVGGVCVTLAALCSAHDIDINNAANKELERVWEKVDVIRAKQAAKQLRSPETAQALP